MFLLNDNDMQKKIAEFGDGYTDLGYDFLKITKN